MGVTEGGCVAIGRLGHGVSMVSENVRLAHLPVVLTLNEALPEADLAEATAT